MSTESRILISNISAEAENTDYSYGEKRKGAGYNRQSDGLHTVVYEVDSFKGSVKIQGTLQEFPGESDWVDIVDTEIGAGSDSTAWTTTQTTNFYGNFLWIRAAYNVQDGTIVAVRYNY